MYVVDKHKGNVKFIKNLNFNDRLINAFNEYNRDSYDMFVRGNEYIKYAGLVLVYTKSPKTTEKFDNSRYNCKFNIVMLIIVMLIIVIIVIFIIVLIVFVIKSNFITKY